MSKNVKVNGVNYSGVSQVQLPTTAGGTALFKDVDEITTPSGTINITENGTHNVSAYAQAVVNVASGGESADNEGVEMLLRIMVERIAAIKEDTHIVVPSYVTAIGNGAFAETCGDASTGKVYLTVHDNIDYIGGSAFSYATKVVMGELPKQLKKIHGNAFVFARDIFGDATELEIPASVEELDTLAFYRYTGGVNTVTFKGTPTSIAANAFQDCSIKTVNVPWAEGAVANAPWGAETVNYNYTGA